MYIINVARNVLFIFLFLVSPLIAHADDKYDWNGRWIFHRIDKDGKVIYDKIGGAVDIADGKVRNLWSGCFYLPVESYAISGKKVRARFSPPGVDYTIVLVRIEKDKAKVVFRNQEDGYVRGDEPTDEFASRVPVKENCPDAPYHD